MESEVLTTAKQYQERREWKKAIYYYGIYKQQQKLSDVTVYTSYAKCLRNAGRIDQAKELLMEGRALYPENREIFQELYALYKKTGEWHKAKTAAETLIALAPQQDVCYFQLGRACAFLKDDTNAKQAYISGLELRHQLSHNQLIANIKQGFTTDPGAYSSEYVYINGKNNYGAIMHHKADQTYITKITKYDKNAKREAAFYRDIYPQFPWLKEIAPAYIDSQVMDGILYLTIEWMDGSEVTQEQTKPIIDLAARISSIPYSDIIHVHPNPAYVFQFRNKPTFIIQFFTQIHEKHTNEKLFSELYKLLEQNHYPESTYQLINRLEALIMKHDLYVFIDPRKHYSLLHGDFHPTNIKMRNQDQAMKVFDWASFTTGPHFLDIARYLSKSLFSYQDVKTIYLNNEQTGGKLTLIERIFFLYALILLYLLRLKAKEVEKYMPSCIDPSLKDLETCVTQFMNEEYALALGKLRDEKNEQDHQVELLEDELHDKARQNKALKKQVQQLKKRNKNILESKSWKITAPLRKLRNGKGENARKK